MDKIEIANVTLKMWEKTMMPKSEKIDGKFVKTGEKEEQTTLTFTDQLGSKLVFLTSEPKYRELEGKLGDLHLALEYDSYNKRNKILFRGFVEA